MGGENNLIKDGARAGVPDVVTCGLLWCLRVPRVMANGRFSHEALAARCGLPEA